MQGIRWNTLVRIVVGITQVGLGLLMVLLSRRFIDVTIRTGSNRDVWIMVALLVAVVIGGIALRQLYYYMSTLAMTRSLRLYSARLTAGISSVGKADEKTSAGQVRSINIGVCNLPRDYITSPKKGQITPSNPQYLVLATHPFSCVKYIHQQTTENEPLKESS